MSYVKNRPKCSPTSMLSDLTDNFLCPKYTSAQMAKVGSIWSLCIQPDLILKSSSLFCQV
jgi:hypothetical protein